MLDAAYEWIKNLSFYLVIMTAVLEVLPGEAYRKYIRFFTGLVMILLVAAPVLRVTGSYGVFQEKYQKKEQEFRMETERQRKAFEEADVFEFLPEEYEVYLKNDTEEENEQKEEKENRKTQDGGGTKKSKIIKVEDVRIGKDEEPDMESDTFRE